MRCDCNDSEKFQVHKRRIEITNFHRKMIEMNMNPYSQYDEHPVVSREIKMAKEMVLERNPDLRGINLLDEITTYGTHVELRIMI